MCKYVIYVHFRTYTNCVQQTLQLIPPYSKIVYKNTTLPAIFSSGLSSFTSSEDDEFDFDSTLTVFSETKALDLTSHFCKDADAFYVEAKQSTVSSIAQIPYWMYGVLVVLG